ncbi:1,2-dihydroxy-3-keto-5-methylthiopentene dioxygenase [Pseudomonas chlororaphis]|uniref:Acireductone dioxygenase n=1 Tax=Pseudomonas chlororaphis TaxID=587753 RepID=A0A1Q8EL18_9PSED|nr:acireductone dioxygenase [Pseudomonas chlororaphis]OLF52491.1 acireductone dioxygenase [Pseudomonas chlororaphis]
MSSLSVYHLSSPDLPNKVLTHFDDIAATLAEQGVRFERWQAATRIVPGASQEEVLAAYQEQIDRLMTERGYLSADVISVDEHHPQKAELRGRFLDEHRQAEDELRLFVAGRGLLNLHIDDYVYAVFCEKHDLILLPAGTAHWFDIGENPYLLAIRLFKNAHGWAAEFTGSDLASQFPRLDD